MSDADRVTVRFARDHLKALEAKAKEVGMSPPELIRLAVASFLSKEDSLSGYLDALEPLADTLAVLLKRQEQFARSLGALCVLPDIHKTDATKQSVADRFSQIVDTVN